MPRARQSLTGAAIMPGVRAPRRTGSGVKDQQKHEAQRGILDASCFIWAFGPCERMSVSTRLRQDIVMSCQIVQKDAESFPVSQLKITLQASVDYIQRRLYGNPHPT